MNLESIRARLSPERTIESISSISAHPALEKLVGARGGKGLRSALNEALPPEHAAGTLLYFLIDDFAGTSLVAPWAWFHWTTGETSPPVETTVISNMAERAKLIAKMKDVCTGLRQGSSALEVLMTAARPNSTDVDSLPNPTDPLSWHTLPATPGISMRRARRIDIWREEDLIHIDAMFQDSASNSSGLRSAVHEYTLKASANARTNRLTGIEATPRILPYSECPGAVAHIQRLVGMPLPDFRTIVIEQLPKTLGCTHLNDAMRALADIPAMLSMLDETHA